MSKHTPGPWTVGLRGEYGTQNANIIFSNGGESSVATVYDLPMHTKLEEVDPRYAKGMANARLIASAPELLEALRLVEQHLPFDWAFDSIQEFVGQNDYREACAKARAAIAKAEGGEG
jgi:hypothetical protein